MGRLIDADALNKELQRSVGSPTTAELYKANLCIINMPTIDAASVVHGHWEFCGDDDLICSECGARYFVKWLKQSYHTGVGSDKMDGFLYCPHCGSIMDGGNTNG